MVRVGLGVCVATIEEGGGGACGCQLGIVLESCAAWSSLWIWIGYSIRISG